MYVYQQESYLSLTKVLEKQLATNASIVVVTIPGMGATFCLKSYLVNNKNNDLAMVTGEGAELKKMNILDLDFHSNSLALSMVDNYMKMATPNQKFIVVIDSPSVIESEAYRSSYCSEHIYDYYYFSAMGKKDCDLLALGNNPKLTEVELTSVYELSGGIGRIAKFLAINGSNGIEAMVAPIAEEIRKCHQDTLVKLGLVSDGKFISRLINRYLKETTLSQDMDIKVNFDLTVIEKGEQTKKVLTKTERDILVKMLAEKEVISKSDVSDIKWGMGKYDEFSDQAINKTMRRLSEKLTNFEIETIPKVGYRIREKT